MTRSVAMGCATAVSGAHSTSAENAASTTAKRERSMRPPLVLVMNRTHASKPDANAGESAGRCRALSRERLPEGPEDLDHLRKDARAGRHDLAAIDVVAFAREVAD